MEKNTNIINIPRFVKMTYQEKISVSLEKYFLYLKESFWPSCINRLKGDFCVAL